MHRSRVCHLVTDVPDPDQGVAFWSAALGAVEEPLPEISSGIYRHLRLPDSEIRILLQRPTTPRSPRSGCILTWRPTTSKQKSNA
jgi:hypothetical protein